MYVRNMRWKGVDFINLAQDREAVSSCKHGKEDFNSTKKGNFWSR
jgi:hypothetical protein